MNNHQLEHKDYRPSKQCFAVSFLAHDILSPLNIGSLFRIADALGVEHIYLSGGSPVPPGSKIKKTSRSTEKYVPYSFNEDPAAVLNELRSEGYKIISLEITSDSQDISKLQLSETDKICLVLGSENKGICDRLLKLSDKTVHIPMFGENSSMNVANACSIATYSITSRLKSYLK